uniref:Uncharacterized protein n=1 Tax=Setaria digitata TaxID=48799 RepID=A0A915PT78_9BILA
MMSTETVLPVTESTGPPVPEQLETTELLSTATKNAEEKCSTEAKPESEVTMLTADEEKTKQEVLLPDPSHFKENINLTIDKGVTTVNKLLDVAPELSPPVTLQSFTAATPATPGNVLQSSADEHKMISEAEMKSEKEETERKLQSIMTNLAEKSVKYSDSPDRAAQPSPESKVSVQLSAVPPKNVPPPVPPKKKSIEMILAEEAKAMGQHSLRGSEAVVHESLSSESRNEKLELKNKMMQNIETSKIQEECETAADETKKHETMKKPVTEFQQADPKQIEKLETSKPEAHPTIPKGEAKPQESITDKADKNKTNTLKSKSTDGQQQQQQSRRCTIL